MEETQNSFTEDELLKFVQMARTNHQNHLGNDSLSSHLLDGLIWVDDNGLFFRELLKKDRPFAVALLLSISRKYNNEIYPEYRQVGRYNGLVADFYSGLIDSGKDIEPDELWKILEVLAYTGEKQVYPFLQKLFDSSVMEKCLSYHPKNFPNYEMLENFIRCAYRQEDARAWDLIFMLIQDTRLDDKICGYGMESLAIPRINYSSPAFVDFASKYVQNCFDFKEECKAYTQSCWSKRRLCSLSPAECSRYINLSRIICHLVLVAPARMIELTKEPGCNIYLKEMVLRELQKQSNL